LNAGVMNEQLKQIENETFCGELKKLVTGGCLPSGRSTKDKMTFGKDENND